MSNLERSSLIYSNAQKVLKQLALQEESKEFGELEFTGSYALDLMVWNDIDCQVRFKNGLDPQQGFMQLVSKLFNKKNVKNIKLINFIENKRSTMPEGLYCGINYKYKHEDWKIDIWYLPEQELEKNIQFTRRVNALLDEEKKINILDWKFTLLGNNKRIPHLASYFLYQAILFEKLHTEQEIMGFLKKNGVVGIE